MPRIQLIQKKGELKKIKTYCEGLDQALNGGIPVGNVTLVSGTAGSMKTTFVFNILYNLCKKGNNSLFISLEQSASTLINQFIEMGYDLSAIDLIIVTSPITDIKSKDTQSGKKDKKGKLIIADMGMLRKEIQGARIGSGDWWHVIEHAIKTVKSVTDCSAIAIDSLDALYTLSDFENPRNKLFHIFETLRETGTNSFLISEMPLDAGRHGKYDVEDYLADGVIMLRLIERYRKVTREIAVVKMRGTKTNNDLFTLVYEEGTFKALWGGKPHMM